MKRILAVLFASTMLLAACGGSGSAGPGSDSTGSGPKPSADFNDVDVAFAQGMIPHHMQAVAMADLALKNASSKDVTALAKQIKAAQDPEIKTLKGWLLAWGRTASSSSDKTGGMDPGSDTTMGGDTSGMGMMSTQAMSDLEAAMGAEFDKMFLEMMIEHHKGAIDMAATEKSDGKNADAKALADQIITAQKAEITTMESLLASGA